MEKYSSKLTIKNTIGLLRYNFWPLVFFEIVYTFLGTILIYPVISFMLKKTLAAGHLTYISGSNFRELFTHPLAWVIIFILLLIVAFFVIFELTTLIILFNESKFKRKVQFVSLISAGLKRSTAIIRPRNMLFILLVLFIIPFTNVGFSSSFITEITIPEFIMSSIYASTPLSIAFTLLTLILIILMINWIFSLSAFSLEHKGFFSAVHESRKLIHHRFWKTILSLVFWNLFLAFIFLVSFVLIVFIIMIPAAISIALFDTLCNGTLLFAVILGILSVISNVILSLARLITTPLNLALVSHLYYHYSDEKGIVRDPNPILLQKNIKPFRKRTVVVLSALIFIIMVTLQSSTMFYMLSPDNISESLGVPQVTAHRGSSVNAPENTIAALEGAIADGADYAEIDVAQTRDGVIVVSHDNNLKRISGHNINIWESNYNDIKNLDIGSWFDPKFSDQRIPTLEEAIETCNGKIKLNIELKPTGHEASLVESTIAIINKENFRGDCFLASLSYPTIEQVMARDPGIR
ncbi:MAG: glycerophosphoryl diester phosphodiesterase membrane domain-containing protein, partial [Eubacterium sp.]